MSKESNIGIYSIKKVSQLTGIAIPTLRSWEARYQLIKPVRTGADHRLYSREDIERIKWLKEKVEKEGLRPQQAHEMLAKQLREQGHLAEEDIERGAIMILVAERDPITAELEEYFLRQEGYNVLVLHNGNEALPTAESKQPDLIILDIILPGMNGLKVAKALKENEKTADIPILVFSVLDTRDKALEAGADAFLLKPIDQPKLIEVVKNMLVKGETKIG